jgi:hypothetical protein
MANALTETYPRSPRRLRHLPIRPDARDPCKSPLCGAPIEKLRHPPHTPLSTAKSYARVRFRSFFAIFDTSSLKASAAFLVLPREAQCLLTPNPARR